MAFLAEISGYAVTIFIRLECLTYYLSTTSKHAKIGCCGITGDRSAVNLGGQTLQTVINLASIEPEETVLSLLRRMQDTQTLQSRHAAAPRFHLMEALGDAGELVPWVANMALFVRIFFLRPFPLASYRGTRRGLRNDPDKQ